MTGLWPYPDGKVAPFSFVSSRRWPPFRITSKHPFPRQAITRSPVEVAPISYRLTTTVKKKKKISEGIKKKGANTKAEKKDGRKDRMEGKEGCFSLVPVLDVTT